MIRLSQRMSVEKHCNPNQPTSEVQEADDAKREPLARTTRRQEPIGKPSPALNSNFCPKYQNSCASSASFFLLYEQRKTISHCSKSIFDSRARRSRRDRSMTTKTVTCKWRTKANAEDLGCRWLLSRRGVEGNDQLYMTEMGDWISTGQSWRMKMISARTTMWRAPQELCQRLRY